MKRSVEPSPEIAAEFVDYLKFLKEDGQPLPSGKKQLDKAYFNFIFFSKVLRNSRLAEQTRESAIRRAADVMGFDPNNQEDLTLMLGILAYKEFPEVPKRRGDRRARLNGPKRTFSN
jgi:hypothetical protein